MVKYRTLTFIKPPCNASSARGGRRMVRFICTFRHTFQALLDDVSVCRDTDATGVLYFKWSTF